jgi:hypothetical protein
MEANQVIRRTGGREMKVTLREGSFAAVFTDDKSGQVQVSIGDKSPSVLLTEYEFDCLYRVVNITMKLKGQLRTSGVS